jgi:hypothetical protein
MHGGRPKAQPLLEATHELWCQAYLGDEYEYLLAGPEHGFDEPQVDFGFATARNPVEYESPKSVSLPDRLHGLFLIGVEYRAFSRARHVREVGFHTIVDRQCAFVEQDTCRPPPSWLLSRQAFRVYATCTGVSQSRQKFGLPGCAPRQLGRVRRCSSQPQAFGSGSKRLAMTERDRQRCRGNFADRVMVIVTRKAHQAQVIFAKDGLLVEYSVRAAQPPYRYVGARSVLHHNADFFASAERNADACANRRGCFFRWEVVERSRQRNVDSNLKNQWMGR